MDPYAQHTPHTFPLQGSPNHYHQYFYFPPSTIPSGVTTNGHQTASAHNSRLRAVQIQEQQQQQQQWSNPVLSPLLVKRMNENAASMSMDDDEDPSASIDALVGKFYLGRTNQNDILVFSNFSGCRFQSTR
jgi:hypothetical protein